MASTSTAQAPSTHGDERNEEQVPRPAKRTRVSNACQRCKKRKQKCDGGIPSCSNCSTCNAVCQYLRPLKPNSKNRDFYVRAAETRVAELETVLSRQGIVDEGSARWKNVQIGMQSYVSDHEETEEGRFAKRPCRQTSQLEYSSNEAAGQKQGKKVNRVVDILRDLSLEASGGYIGASSSITMSRMVGSLVKSKIDAGLLGSGDAIGEHLSPKSAIDVDEDSSSELGSMPQEVADKLLRGYLKHISTRWPILHSAFIRDLHSRRSSLGNCYETAVLHLVYACGMLLRAFCASFVLY